MLHGHRKLDSGLDPNRPTLRRAPGSGTGTVDPNGDGSKSSGDDDRPTLKRRDNN